MFLCGCLCRRSVHKGATRASSLRTAESRRLQKSGALRIQFRRAPLFNARSRVPAASCAAAVKTAVSSTAVFDVYSRFPALNAPLQAKTGRALPARWAGRRSGAENAGGSARGMPGAAALQAYVIHKRMSVFVSIRDRVYDVVYRLFDRFRQLFIVAEKFVFFFRHAYANFI